MFCKQAVSLVKNWKETIAFGVWKNWEINPQNCHALFPDVI